MTSTSGRCGIPCACSLRLSMLAPSFTQELPRKLLPTRAKVARARCAGVVRGAGAGAESGFLNTPSIMSTLAAVDVGKGAGSRTKGLLMAYKPLAMAQVRRRRLDGAHHLPLVRAGSPRETRAADRWRVGRTVPSIILSPA